MLRGALFSKFSGKAWQEGKTSSVSSIRVMRRGKRGESGSTPGRRLNFLGGSARQWNSKALLSFLRESLTERKDSRSVQHGRGMRRGMTEIWVRVPGHSCELETH